MIPGKGRMDAGVGRQIGSRGCNSLDSGLLIARDDRDRFALARLGARSFQHLDFTMDAQNLGHLPLERTRPRTAVLRVYPVCSSVADCRYGYPY
jgi:hypothetical protein